MVERTCRICGVVFSYEPLPTGNGRRQLCEACKRGLHNARGHRWVELNREKRRQISNAWVERNFEQMRTIRADWKRRNPEAVRAARRARKKRNPIANRAYVRGRNARIRGNTVVPFTPVQLLARMAYYGDRCWMCGLPANSIDHVKPISKGGAHMLCNLRPACRSCNSSKNDRWPLESA